MTAQPLFKYFCFISLSKAVRLLRANLLSLARRSTQSRRHRHGAHVGKPPSMAVWVDKAVRIHEAVILWLVVGRATRGDRSRNEVIYLLPALATEREQHLDGLACIADVFGREATKPGVRKQHNKNCVADDDARASVVAALRIM